LGFGTVAGQSVYGPCHQHPCATQRGYVIVAGRVWSALRATSRATIARKESLLIAPWAVLCCPLRRAPSTKTDPAPWLSSSLLLVSTKAVFRLCLLCSGTPPATSRSSLELSLKWGRWDLPVDRPISLGRQGKALACAASTARLCSRDEPRSCGYHHPAREHPSGLKVEQSMLLLALNTLSC